MDRGISTVVDVIVALSLVSAAAVVLVTANSPGEQPADTAFRGQSATDIAGTLLSTTIAVSYDSPEGRRVVRGPAGVILADAAVAAVPPKTDAETAFIDATRAEVRDVLGLLEPGVAIVAAVPPGPRNRSPSRVQIGSAPPPGADVDTVVYRLPSRESTSPAESITLVIRMWSA